MAVSAAVYREEARRVVAECGDPVEVIAQAIADAVEDFRSGGAYCIDCGKEMDDWRPHEPECAYRDEEEN